MGVSCVSECTRVLPTDSAQAANLSFSSSREATPVASISTRNRSRMKRNSLSTLPRPWGR